MEIRYKKILPIAAIIAIVIIAAVLLVPAATTGRFSGIESKETTNVKIGYVPLIHGLPLYLAYEKGYFTKEGLNVELVKFEAPNQMIDAIMQGQIDLTGTVAGSGIAAVADNKNPGKIKLYALSGGTENNPNEVLLVQKDSTITTIAELKGKKLGILGGSIQWRTIARDMLAKNGLEMDKDVTIVELAPGLQVQALASKQIDALLALDPMATVAINNGIGKIIISAPMEKIISDPFYPGAGVINAQFAANNPNTAKKTIDIINQATKEINENPYTAREYLKGYTPLDENTIKKVTLPTIKTCDELTSNDISALQKFYDLFATYKVVDGNIDAKSLLYCAGK